MPPKQLPSLKKIRPSLLKDNRLEIELTNNAYFAAERIRRCPAGEPPWDVIISDVYMPFPCRADDPYTPELEASLTHYQTDGKAWRTWEFPYATGELDEKVKNGGFHIAETIAARFAAGEDMPDLKMILMSNCLEGADRDRIMVYQETRSSWLKYYDKAYWQRDQLTAWPKRQSEPNVFQWALVRAIAERHAKDWGQLTYERYNKEWGWLIDDNTPDVQAVVGDAVTDALNEIVEEVRRFGEAKDIQVILITGEVGTGREVFAKLIHNLRMRTFGGKGEFVALDCSSISHEAFERELFDYVEEIAGGTLFIDEVDKLTPPHQGKIYHLLKERRLRSVDRLQSVDLAADLTICTASNRNLEELNLSGLFHDDLYYLLRDEQLHVNPLRARPADAVSIAEVLAQQSGDELKLSADARKWIQTYHWPGNNKELRSVITAASRRSSSTILTAADLERVVRTGRRGPVVGPDEEKPSEQIQIFRAEAPFQLHWEEPVLIDAKNQKIVIPPEIHTVLKGLLHKEEGGSTRDYLTFSEIAAIYRTIRGADRGQSADQVAHNFARSLRRCLRKHGIEKRLLVKSSKGMGYVKADGWANKPTIQASEAGLVFTDQIENFEGEKHAKTDGAEKKAAS